MADPNVIQLEKDIRDGQLSYEGITGLVNNFECYVVTDARYDKETRDIKEIFRWCEDTLGEHRVEFLFIPDGIIEQERNYWFLGKVSHASMFKLRWNTIGNLRLQREFI